MMSKGTYYSASKREESQLIEDGDRTADLPRTFKYLMATQFLSRGIPFIFNTWIVRHLTEKDYALYAVQFHLFVTCVLFLSREGFRRACMRADFRCDGTSNEENTAKLLKIAWMTLPLGVVISIAACVFVFWWQYLSYSDPYAQAILIHGFACMLELLAEPLYILSQNLLLLKLRLMVETAATLLRCVTTYILIIKQTNMEKAIVFALAQTSYGACMFLGYWGYFLLIHVIKSSDLFPFRSASGGEYAQKSRKLGTCLTDALKLVLLIGLVVMAFGPSFSYALIRLLYGQKWSDGEASTALRYYCLYVIVLAMNGTSEAFLHAVATENQLKRSNDSLLIFSLIYLVLNVLLIRSAGAVGLILANSLNMLFRIIYSIIFIRQYFKDTSSFSFYHCLPSGWTVLLFFSVVTLVSEKIFLDRDNFWPTFSIHFSIGATCFCFAALIIYHRERHFINKVVRFREHAD